MKKVICDNCDTEGAEEDMNIGPDPYALEIYDDETECILCDDCYFEIMDDI